MSELALQLIRENKRTKDTFLDLGHCGLKYELPEELGECVWLEGLNLGTFYRYDKSELIRTKNNGGGNKFQGKELSFLEGLIKLESLYLHSNQIQDISFLQNLTKLQFLYLSENQIHKIQGLEAMTNLHSLYLNRNQIQQIQGLEKLTNLRSLHLSRNQIQQIQGLEELANLHSLDLSENQIHKIQGLEALTNLHSLDLSENQIRQIQGLEAITNLHSLYLGINQIQQIQGLETLTNLQELYLIENQIQEIQGLEALSNLQSLDLYGNQIQQLQGLEALTNLQNLYLNRNQIQQLHGLEGLANLKELGLKGNQIQDISPLLNSIKKGLSVSASPNAGDIDLEDNPIIIPPINIINQGNKAIIRFLENPLETKYEGKLLIVGEPEAGKTTLRNRLMIQGYKVPGDTTSTVGIQVDKWKPKKPRSKGKVMDINIWDFGGQEIQYMTHQFFLTPDALYVLLTSARKDLDNLDYWFNIIRLLGKNENNQHSKLLVVANEIKMEKVTHFVEKDFKGRYPDLDFECYHVNFATAKNKDGRFNDLVNHIRENLALLPSMGRPLPVKWGIVRTRLAQMKENSISIDRYLQICAEAELDMDSAYDLSGYLHTIGEAIHFRNDRLVSDFIILKPKWAVDAVYVILKNEAIKNGHFTEKQVYDIWKKNGYPEDEWNRLIRLMAKDNFEVSYPLPESNTDFIAPQLLTDTSPEYDWESNDTLKFRYSYAFMPKGIMTRFIVRMHEDIAYQNEEGLVWKNGVVLQDEYMGYRAQVRETKIQEPGLERKVIDIEIMGDKGHRKSLLKKVCRNIEKIHNEIFTGLAYERLVPCNCKDCAGTESPTFFDYTELVELYKESLNARCRKNRIKEVNIKDIFEEIVDLTVSRKQVIKSNIDKHIFRAMAEITKHDNLFTLTDPFDAKQKDNKIFFSYAWGDNKETGESREQIVNELYDSMISDKFEVVRDKVDSGYRESIIDFMEKIGKGKFVIVALSNKYFESPNCMFELYEVYRNSRFDEKEFKEKIYPILVEKIDFTDEVIQKYLEHWEKEIGNKENLIKESPKRFDEKRFKGYRTIVDIHSKFVEIIMILKDMNLSTRELLSKDNFEEIKRAIKLRQTNG